MESEVVVVKDRYVEPEVKVALDADTGSVDLYITDGDGYTAFAELDADEAEHAGRKLLEFADKLRCGEPEASPADTCGACQPCNDCDGCQDEAAEGERHGVEVFTEDKDNDVHFRVQSKTQTMTFKTDPARAIQLGNAILSTAHACIFNAG